MAVAVVVLQVASLIFNVKCVTSMGTLLLFVIFALMDVEDILLYLHNILFFQFLK